jgi:hypothetical protein
MKMYFKNKIAKVGKEIIQKHKEEKEKNGWLHLSFSLETIYQYQDLVLNVREASNYLNKVEMDRQDLINDNEGENIDTIDLWIISDHILEYIDNQGYEID